MEPIVRSSGTTETERHLASLCERTFLSLWSYPNLYTPEGIRGGKGVGKELCDLLVVFGCDVIIFSDKDISFNDGIDVKVAWNRWRKRAILNSARQLFGAEKWIREHPNEIYLDPLCEHKFPLPIEAVEKNLRFHLIAVTKNTAASASRYFGMNSTGSLMIIPKLTDKEVADLPFVTHDIDPSKTFVHVLDEYALNILFKEIDTTYDLIRYLRAKEWFVRNGKLGIAPGEEDLLAHYLMSGGLINDKPFGLPRKIDRNFHSIMLPEGLWDEYLHSEQRTLMRKANKVSYYWDSVIENFAHHIRLGTVALESDKPVAQHERAIRFMAAEGRLARRFLSNMFLEKMAEVASDRRSSRVCASPFDSSVCFILVLYPCDDEEDYAQYRDDRVALLHMYGLVANYKLKKFKYYVLMATEPKESKFRSEDVLVLEGHIPSVEEIAEAKRLMSEEKILSDIKYTHRYDSMSPNRKASKAYDPPLRKSKIGRNEPCPCGSGKKWKKCCGSTSA